MRGFSRFGSFGQWVLVAITIATSFSCSPSYGQYTGLVAQYAGDYKFYVQNTDGSKGAWLGTGGRTYLHLAYDGYSSTSNDEIYYAYSSGTGHIYKVEFINSGGVHSVLESDLGAASQTPYGLATYDGSLYTCVKSGGSFYAASIDSSANVTIIDVNKPINNVSLYCGTGTGDILEFFTNSSPDKVVTVSQSDGSATLITSALVYSDTGTTVYAAQVGYDGTYFWIADTYTSHLSKWSGTGSDTSSKVTLTTGLDCMTYGTVPWTSY